MTTVRASARSGKVLTEQTMGLGRRVTVRARTGPWHRSDSLEETRQAPAVPGGVSCRPRVATQAERSMQTRHARCRALDGSPQLERRRGTRRGLLSHLCRSSSRCFPSRASRRFRSSSSSAIRVAIRSRLPAGLPDTAWCGVGAGGGGGRAGSVTHVPGRAESGCLRLDCSVLSLQPVHHLGLLPLALLLFALQLHRVVLRLAYRHRLQNCVRWRGSSWLRREVCCQW